MIKKTRKKLLALGIAVMLGCSQAALVSADLRSDLESVQNQKSQTRAALNNAQSAIDVLEDKKVAITGEINTLDAELIVTLAAIDSLKNEIAVKEEEIAVTEANLAKAQQDEEDQYQLMKKRIQFLYETGGDGAWLSMILNGKSYSEILNQVEYTQKLYEYDRECLEEYMDTVQKVTEYKEELTTQKAELEESKAEQESQQQRLEEMLAEKRATCADYEHQLANLEEKAAEYSYLISQQNAKIQQLQAQIEAEEEAARQEAARQEAARQEAARQEAARQEAARQEAARQETARQQAASQQTSNNSSNNSSSSSSGSSNNSSSGSSSSGNSSSNSSSSGNSSSNSSSSNSSSSNSGSSGSSSNNSSSNNSSSSGSSSSGSSYSGTGSSVISYACQFVGNPYVWGGESLTRGADCSGFIMAVYAHFGVSLPHSSAAMRSCGYGVSYSEARPGDIICYDGHVALYMGNGQIVHASNAKDGIKISPNAAYRTILAVRRVI